MLSYCSKDHMAHKCKIFTIWLFMEKFANPWSRQFQAGICPISNGCPLLVVADDSHLCLHSWFCRMYTLHPKKNLYSCDYIYIYWIPLSYLKTKLEQKDSKLLIRKYCLIKVSTTHCQYIMVWLFQGNYSSMGCIAKRSWTSKLILHMDPSSFIF